MLIFQPYVKYFQLSGRARRAEFWLFWFIAVFIFSVISVIDDGIGLLSGLFYLFIIIPSITVSVRRLHDTDRSGYWFLLALLLGGVLGGVLGVGVLPGVVVGEEVLPEVLPVVLPLTVAWIVVDLILLVFYCLDGTKGENRYGPDPKSR